MRNLLFTPMLVITLVISVDHRMTAAQTNSPSLNLRQPGSLTFEPYKLKSGSQEIDAELGHLIVKENRRNPKSHLIELAFVRLKSTAAKPGYPVVYLEGGPGSSAINIAQAPEYLRAFLKLREVGDVILLDQRGVGRSRPNLWRASSTLLPPDAFANRQVALKALMERAREAANYFREQGVDLAAYNTAESAHDLDDLRRALGAAKLNLVGFSYGTHLGLAALRYHGDHLNRVALIGTEGQNHTRKLPSTSDAALRRLSALAAKDPNITAKMPDLFGTLKQLLERLEKEPITFKLTRRGSNEPLEIKVGKFGLQTILMLDLGDTSDLPYFPAVIYSLAQGDYESFKPIVERRFFQYSAGISLMTQLMDASSGATKARDAQIAREAKLALLGDAMNFPYPELGAVFGNPDLGDEYRSPLRTAVPTLFISGTLDNNTPPFQADEVRRTFRRSTHLIVENAGHESMLEMAEVQQAVRDYLNGRDVSRVRLALPPIQFVPLPEKK